MSLKLVIEAPAEDLHSRSFAAYLPSRQWGYEMNFEILKVPLLVGWVLFILIRNLDIQKSVCCFKQKEINL